MGTNYFLRHNICKCCNRYDELHIGKSSAGWHFGLRVYSYLNSLDDWKKEFDKPDCEIYDEYDRKVSPTEMIQTITNRSSERPPCDIGPDAEIGLNNLLAHTYMARRSEGTWDYMDCEFS